MKIYYIVKEELADAYNVPSVTGSVHASPKEAVKALQNRDKRIPNTGLVVLCWEPADETLFYWMNGGQSITNALPGMTHSTAETSMSIFGVIKKSLSIEMCETEIETETKTGRLKK
jgi:hypothetical protein